MIKHLGHESMQDLIFSDKIQKDSQRLLTKEAKFSSAMLVENISEDFI